MPHCSHCARTIDYIEVHQPSTEIGHLRADGEIDWIDNISDDDTSYQCPECGYQLTRDRTEAEEILNYNEDDDEEKSKVEKPKKVINKLIGD